jgi:hypothetical protein
MQSFDAVIAHFIVSGSRRDALWPRGSNYTIGIIKNKLTKNDIFELIK